MNGRPEAYDMHRPHVVYVIRDESGAVAYVGMTREINERLNHHRLAYKHHWPYAPHTVEEHEVSDRAEARALERRLIREYEPRENVHHNPARSRRASRLLAVGEARAS